MEYFKYTTVDFHLNDTFVRKIINKKNLFQELRWSAIYDTVDSSQ